MHDCSIFTIRRAACTAEQFRQLLCLAEVRAATYILRVSPSPSSNFGHDLGLSKTGRAPFKNDVTLSMTRL